MPFSCSNQTIILKFGKRISFRSYLDTFVYLENSIHPSLVNGVEFPTNLMFRVPRSFRLDETPFAEEISTATVQPLVIN